MTDAHCHVSCGDGNVRELLIGRDFFGAHPWESLGFRVEGLGLRESIDSALSSILYPLSSNPQAGVGEIGLDRLKAREIPPLMRELFEAQLKLAIDLRRPVVLHGAKCWGQVVAAVRKLITNNQQPTTRFLFHGFSRSDGLIPDIVALGGFISVGPAVLNDHAVNYRELVKKIPLERLLVETDRTEVCGAPRTSPPTEGEVGADVLTAERSKTAEGRRPCPTIAEVLAKTAELRGLSTAELEAITDRNADAFMRGAR